MRIPECVLLVVLGTYALGADGDQNVGYVDCSTGDKHRSTPIFANPCISRVDGAERYIGIISISQKKNRFVALDLPAPTGQYVLDCSAFRTRTGKSLACAIDQKNPEYTQAARRAGLAPLPPRPAAPAEPRTNSLAASRLEEAACDAPDEHRAARLQAAVRWIDVCGRDLAAVLREGNFGKAFPLGPELAREAEAALREALA